MVEPTESEDLAELDRFIDAMIAIKGEIDRGGGRRVHTRAEPLRQAPHTAVALISDDLDAGLPARTRRLPAALAHARQVLPPGSQDRRRPRRPQPGLLLPAHRSLRRLGPHERAEQAHSPVQPSTKRTAQVFTDFGGWQMPLKYRSELEEHHTVRRAAGLFDLSHMGEVLVTGPQAAEFLNYALVGNLAVIAVGKAKYSLICTEDGGVIDDLITTGWPRTRTSWFRTPPTPTPSPRPCRKGLPSFDVAVEDQSEDHGPRSPCRDRPPRRSSSTWRAPRTSRRSSASLKYYAAVEVELAGLPGPSGPHRLHG